MSDDTMSPHTVLWFLQNDSSSLLRMCKNESILPKSRLLVLATVGVHSSRNDATIFADAMMGDSVPFVRAEAAALLSVVAPPHFLVQSLDHGYRLRD